MPTRPEDRCPACGEARPLLTINEAARLARVNRKTIYRWMNGGTLEYCVLPSGLIRIYKDSLIRRPGEQAAHAHPGAGYGPPPNPDETSLKVAEPKPAPPARRRPRARTT